jgi:hypothetical protein
MWARNLPRRKARNHWDHISKHPWRWCKSPSHPKVITTVAVSHVLTLLRTPALHTFSRLTIFMLVTGIMVRHLLTAWKIFRHNCTQNLAPQWTESQFSFFVCKTGLANNHRPHYIISDFLVKWNINHHCFTSFGQHSTHANQSEVWKRDDTYLVPTSHM